MGIGEIIAAAHKWDAAAIDTACKNSVHGPARQMIWERILPTMLQNCLVSYGAHHEKIMRRWIFGGDRSLRHLHSILPSMSEPAIRSLQRLLYARLAENASSLWPHTVRLCCHMHMVFFDARA